MMIDPAAEISRLRAEVARLDAAVNQGNALLDAALIAKRELAAEIAWQPIETAPRDGTPVITRVEYRGKEGITILKYEYADSGGAWESVYALGTPTHWVPLPQAPSIEQPASTTALDPPAQP